MHSGGAYSRKLLCAWVIAIAIAAAPSRPCLLQSSTSHLTLQCMLVRLQAWLQASTPATAAATTTAQGLSEQQLHTMLVQSFAHADPEASGSVSRQVTICGMHRPAASK